ncbi:MAG: hypothetical protein ACK55I_37090, partial [bacterium]
RRSGSGFGGGRDLADTLRRWARTISGASSRRAAERVVHVLARGADKRVLAGAFGWQLRQGSARCAGISERRDQVV